MTRRQFLRTNVALPALWFNPAGQPVLLGVCDVWPEPVLERLKQLGTFFPRAYAPTPDKSSGRAAILASRYPHAPAPSLLPQLGAAVKLFTDLGQLVAAIEQAPQAPAIATGISGDGGETPASARIPLLIRHPSRPEAALFSAIDVLPLLFHWAGKPIPEGLHGQATTARESIYSYGQTGTPQEWRMVIRGLDKLVVNARLEVTACYNLGQDPQETTNLFRDPAYSRTRAEMRAHLREWMKRTGHQMDRSGLKIRA